MAEQTTIQNAIDLQGVSKCYADQRVVNRIDLSINAGERFALLGHNGAGKTTLIKMILGLCYPSEGDIIVQGHNIRSDSSHSANIGYLPESVAFHESMTGLEVIRFYARLKKRGNPECNELLDQVGLTQAARQRVRTYSKGMRQRLGLAQAMLGNPSLMLLDEPTSGLDPSLRALFYKIIEQRTAAGSTALISSHALTEIEASVDRIAILKGGSLVACGSLESLRREAGLPTQMRIHVPAGGTAAVAECLRNKVEIQKINLRTVDLNCMGEQKMDVLRALGSLDKPILDVDISPVKLERLYEYFTNGSGTNK